MKAQWRYAATTTAIAKASAAGVEELFLMGTRLRFTLLQHDATPALGLKRGGSQLRTERHKRCKLMFFLNKQPANLSELSAA